MLKTGIQFSKKDFEYDVYSLVRAFDPSCEIEMFIAGEEGKSGEFERLMVLEYESEQIICSVFLQGSLVLKKSVQVVYDEDRKETKNRLKQLVYQVLSELSGKSLPWGTLTGIRPTKIPMQMLEQGMKNTEIAQYMRETYFTSNEKTALAIAVANREKAILEPIDYENGYSLYIGIPFCPSICLYCSFGSHPMERWGNRMEEYLNALLKEISYIKEIFSDKTLDTIYIGGGTPTTLTAEQMERLLSHVEQEFDLSQVKEFTVEAGRPDSITEDKLRVIKNHPVTRISINPQTMHQKTLDLIGRGHTTAQIKESFVMARNLGFDNINMDLIVGLPGEGKEEVEETLRQIKEMDPDSLTVHSLSLKRATRLNLFKDQYTEISFENSQEIMSMAACAASEMGMHPYYLYRQKNIAGNFENVGYAKVDKAGIYNILIMEEKQTIMAAGAGASTKLVFDDGKRIERVENVKAVDHYISRIDEMLERKKTGIEKWLR